MNQDVSTSRFELYAWAWKLFREHPLFGIGWGMYRTTVVGNVTFRAVLDTHNIYLQLLAETGLIGFLVFVTLFLYMWIKTKNAYLECLQKYPQSIWKMAISFSLLYQTFFLLYGLTGNTLYDQHNQILYMISCSILASYRFITIRNMEGSI